MNNQTDSLGTEPIGKLLFKLSTPAIAAQIVNLLYNIVDRIYLGHIPEIGQLALTGVGVCMPLIMIVAAFAGLVSMGAAPRASIFLGENNKEKAEKTLGNSFTLLVLISLILTVIFMFFAEDMLMLFGASENTIPYAMSYIKIYSLGTIFVQLTLGLNAFISAQGFAKTSMLTVVIGALCNIVLDPIFIFGFHMGTQGAALATIISQAVSMIWILFFLTGKKTNLKLKKKNLKLEKSIVLPAVALGLAPFIMQSTESLLTACFNSSLGKYGGDIAVTSMTIVSSVMQFSMLPLVGLTQGSQPIISYNYGAGNAERVKKAFKMLLVVSLMFSCTLWTLTMLFPGMFVKMFNNDPELVVFASKALRTYMAVVCLFGAQVPCQQTFIALGDAKSSLFLALLRKIFLLIPLIYILPFFFQDKTMAVFLAEPIADSIAVISTLALFAVRFRHTMQKMHVESPD